MSLEPKLTGLRHIGTAGVLSHLGSAEYYANYNGDRGAWAAYPIGDDHIVVLSGNSQSRWFDYILIRTSDGQIVDTFWDGNDEHIHMDGFGVDVYTSMGPDRYVRHAKFDGFTVVGHMKGDGFVDLTIMRVNNDSLVIQTHRMFDAFDPPNPDYPTAWPFHTDFPPTLIKTSESTVTFLAGGFDLTIFGPGTWGLFLFDFEVTAFGATQIGVARVALGNDTSLPVIAVVNPNEVGHRVITAFSQGNNPDAQAGQFARPWYRTKVNTATGETNTKRVLEVPDLHPYRWQWRIITTGRDVYALEEGGRAQPSTPEITNYPGGRLFRYSVDADEFIEVHDVRPAPIFENDSFAYGMVAQTHWFDKHPHSLLISRSPITSKVFYAELTNLDLGLEVGPSLQLPPDPTGVVLADTNHDDVEYPMTQVIDGKYLVLAYGGWFWDPINQWEDWETWIILYERDAPTRIEGRPRSRLLTFSHIAR